MAKISETLGGKISNLGDSWDQMLISVGANTDGVFTNAIAIINDAIGRVTEFNNRLQTASKYKLSQGSLFAGQANQAFNPFASRAGNETQKAVANIQLTEEALNKIVNKTISGAKNVNDFGKALADLKQKADLTKSLTSVSSFVEAVKKTNLTGSFADIRKSIPSLFVDSKKEANAIQQVYQNAINAVIDARRNFTKEVKSDANFGTGKKDKKAKVSIPTVLEIPDNAATDAKEFTRNFKQLTGLEALKVEVPKIELIGKIEPIQLPPLVAFDLAKQQLIIDTQKFLEQADLQIESLSSISNVLSEVSSSMASGFGAIGGAIVDGNSIIDAAGAALLGTISSFISQLGQALIKQGIATIAAGIALNIIAPGSGANKVAGGFGLVAAGGLLSVAGGAGSALANSKNNTKGQQANSGPQFKAFANGGIIYGPTVGLMGEYAGASSNPEVVAPLNKLKDIIGGGQGTVVNASVGISMRELVVKIRQEEKLMGRMG
ncbi:MAG: hypothetical protein EOO45_09230 [Flavobacterium sp.]|nr:MAG: hypothetical protein EOO45_09230 [Flavobacterium sp.]